MNMVTQKFILVKQWFIARPTKQKLLLFVGVMILGWILLPKLFQKNQQEPQYQTTPAERGTLISSVTASGIISSGSNTSITTSASGTVSDIHVKNGDMVQAGQKIATILLDQDAKQRQGAAWASYLSAQNSVNSAKSKMNSLQSALFKANQTFMNGAGTIDPITNDPIYIIQKAEWLQAESDYNNQKGVISQAQASLTSAWLSYQLLSPTLTAPTSGTINLTVAPGYVLPSSADSTTTSTQAVGTIRAADGQLQARVAISEIDAPKVAIGQKATVTLDAFPDKTFTGKVSAIDTNGQVSTGVTNYPTTITLDTSVEGIYPNMAVNTTIITNIADNVILVPSGSVQTIDGASSVRVLKNGSVASVVVETGASNDTQTVIVSGVAEKDLIVTGETTSATSTSRSSGASPFSPTFRAGGLGGGFGTTRR